MPAGSYHNPILAGYYPDPSVTRVGDKYYLVNSTFAHFPGIPIHESTDLVHWKLIGHALSNPARITFDGLGISRGVFAPSIHFHNGTYYVINTLVDAGGNFFVTASESAGTVVRSRVAQGNRRHRSVVLLRRRRQGVHPEQRAARRRPALQGSSRHLDPAVRPRGANKLIGPRKVIVNGGVDLAKKPIWIEGPHLYRIKGWYYLMCAEGGTGAGHSEVIFRAQVAVGSVRTLQGQSDPHATRSAGGPRERRDQCRARRPRRDERRQLVGGVPRLASLHGLSLQHRARDIPAAGHLEGRLARHSRTGQTNSLRR